MANVSTYKFGALWAVLMYVLVTTTQAQVRFIRYVSSDSIPTSLQTRFNSPAALNEYLLQVPAQLQKQGYLASSVDSVALSADTTLAFLFTGAKYNDLNLLVHTNNEQLLRQMGLTVNNSKLKTSFAEYERFSTKLIDFYQNNGYPFASVQLDSVLITQNVISAGLTIHKGSAYRFNSIRVSGTAKISANFIHHYFNITPNSPYNAEKLKHIDQRLRELPYLQQTQPWDVTMLNTGSIVNLYLEPKKSNQVNILAGFLPANQQLGGKLLLTVDANLHLQNAFAAGESVSLVWQQIQPKSPQLHLQYSQPYIFKSLFGVDLLFDLYKRDSSFLNVNGQIGLLYLLSPNNTAKVILQSQQSTVLQIDTLTIKNTQRLPDVADVRSLNIGFDYNLLNTDYRYNPRRGNELLLSLVTGNKTIRKNTAITQLKDPGFDFNSLYDSVKLKSYQVRLKLSAAHYFATGKYTVLKAAINSGLYQSASVYRNELFRIGGYRLLRGFDEESILANRYLVTSLEYRYLIGLNSNVFGFADAGWVKNSVTKQANGYVGAGVGISVETKGGIFNISYAAGKRNDLPFNLKQSKIHIGFVSIF